jgi:hydrogenase/urease accessory protein HupE
MARFSHRGGSMRLSSLFLFLSFTSSAFAHPGHGDEAKSGFLHLLTEPDHVMTVFMVCLIVMMIKKIRTL